jgi:hypothetical protein
MLCKFKHIALNLDRMAPILNNRLLWNHRYNDRSIYSRVQVSIHKTYNQDLWYPWHTEIYFSFLRIQNYKYGLEAANNWGSLVNAPYPHKMLLYMRALVIMMSYTDALNLIIIRSLNCQTMYTAYFIAR